MYSSKLKLVVLTSFLHLCASSNETIKNENLIVQCSWKLVQKYFSSGDSLTGSVLLVSRTSAVQHMQGQIIQALNTDPTNPWSILIRSPNEPDFEETSTYTLPMKPQAFLAVIENVEFDNLEEIVDDWVNLAQQNPLAQYVVINIMSHFSQDEIATTISDILSIFLERRILNINAIALIQNMAMQSWTVLPYDQENDCGNAINSLDMLDVCTIRNEDLEYVDIQEHTRGLLIDKIPNYLSGCTLEVFWRTLIPYMFSDNDNVHGIEWMLLTTISERLHISIDLHNQKRSMVHIIEMLLNGQVDIIIGGIEEDPKLQDFAAVSIPYLQDELTWCVAKAKRTFHWLNFVNVFNIKIYITYVSFLILNAALIYFILTLLVPRFKSGLPLNFLNLFITLVGVALNQPFPPITFKPSLRFCIIMSLFATLILNPLYNSVLISSLTSPGQLPQIKSAHQIAEHRMAITGRPDILHHLEKDHEIFRYVRRHFSICTNLTACLQQATVDEKLAVITSKQFFLHNPTIPRDLLYCVDRSENFGSYLVTMITSKRFRLLHKINPIIQQVIESGHLLKWTRDIELKKDGRVQSNDQQFTNLKVNQILGILVLYIILLCVAYFVFAAEILVHKMIKSRSKIKIAYKIHRYFEVYARK